MKPVQEQRSERGGSAGNAFAWPAVRRLLAGMLALLLGLAADAGFAQLQATEDELKAAFLYNFAGYVEWPAESFSAPAAPLVFAILGADELAGYLGDLSAGRPVNGRPIEVRIVDRDADLDGAHVLFAGDPLDDGLHALLDAAVDASVLTVTESAGPRPPASVINFEVVDARVRFDVSLVVAAEAGLQISSRLLQVALRVLGAGQ